MNRKRTVRLRAGRRPLALVAAGALAVTLAGCGGDDAKPSAEQKPTASQTITKRSPDEVISAAVARSEEASTANVTMSVETTAGGQSFRVRGNGQMDTKRGAMSMELVTEVPEVGSITMKQVVLDGAVYMTGVPGAPEGQWVKMSMDELGVTSGSQVGGSSDPADQLRLLEQVSDGVQEAGTETVNGVKATRYKGTINLDKAADAAADQGAADGEALRKQYEQLGMTSLPFELYIDDEGRPVRMTTTVETTVESQPMSMVSTIDFTDWGTQVDIQAPAGAKPFAEVFQG